MLHCLLAASEALPVYTKPQKKLTQPNPTNNRFQVSTLQFHICLHESIQQVAVSVYIIALLHGLLTAAVSLPGRDQPVHQGQVTQHDL